MSAALRLLAARFHRPRPQPLPDDDEMTLLLRELWLETVDPLPEALESILLEEQTLWSSWVWFWACAVGAPCRPP